MVVSVDKNHCVFYRAMENTLLLMNSRNSLQRKSLSKVEKSGTSHFNHSSRCLSLVGTSGEELADLETLEGQYRAAQDKFKHRKRAVQQMESDMQVSKKTNKQQQQ